MMKKKRRKKRKKMRTRLKSFRNPKLEPHQPRRLPQLERQLRKHLPRLLRKLPDGALQGTHPHNLN